jgi:hypothetical protein
MFCVGSIWGKKIKCMYLMMAVYRVTISCHILFLFLTTTLRGICYHPDVINGDEAKEAQSFAQGLTGV